MPQLLTLDATENQGLCYLTDPLQRPLAMHRPLGSSRIERAASARQSWPPALYLVDLLQSYEGACTRSGGAVGRKHSFPSDMTVNSKLVDLTS